MSSVDDGSAWSHTLHAIQLGALPAIFMALFTCLGLGKEVPPKIAGALQHFAAGILLCTIGTELLPQMVKAQGFAENAAAAIGFFLGVAALILLGIVMPEEGDDDDKWEEEEKNDNNNNKDEEGVGTSTDTSTSELTNGDVDGDVQFSSTGSMGRRQSLFEGGMQAASSIRKRSRQSLLSVARQISSRQTMHHPNKSSSVASEVASLIPKEDSPLVPLPNTTTATTTTKRTDNHNVGRTDTTSPFPMTLLSAIAIDSAMDGLLIGIASAAGPSAGPMMSLSLTVEMSFLGLTLATALQGHPNVKTYPASILGPAVLVLGAATGGLLASLLLEHRALFTGLLSFGTSALLFMVAEELLLEAHEDGGDHVWWVDLQLYVGFYASVMLDKFVPGASSSGGEL